MAKESFFTVNDLGVFIKEPDAVNSADAPKMLYHYTNLPSLALILKNQTLRLMPLTHMDDKQEKETADVDNLGGFYFVSCWTDKEDEIIPMWKMYASLDAGVRIGLPPNPFVRETFPAHYLCDYLGFPVPQEQNLVQVNSLIRLNDLKEGLFCAKMGAESILYKVEYTDDRNRLTPTVASKNDTICFGEYGLVKHEGWDFQNEWRYLLRLFPVGPHGANVGLYTRIQEIFSSMMSGELDPPRSHYDLTLDPEVLAHMEITPSPEMSAGNKVLFDSLVKEYCPKATIRKSSLADTL